MRVVQQKEKRVRKLNSSPKISRGRSCPLLHHCTGHTASVFNCNRDIIQQPHSTSSSWANHCWLDALMAGRIGSLWRHHCHCRFQRMLHCCERDYPRKLPPPRPHLLKRPRERSGSLWSPSLPPAPKLNSPKLFLKLKTFARSSSWRVVYGCHHCPLTTCKASDTPISDSCTTFEHLVASSCL